MKRKFSSLFLFEYERESLTSRGLVIDMDKGDGLAPGDNVVESPF